MSRLAVTACTVRSGFATLASFDTFSRYANRSNLALCGGLFCAACVCSGRAARLFFNEGRIDEGAGCIRDWRALVRGRSGPDQLPPCRIFSPHLVRIVLDAPISPLQRTFRTLFSIIERAAARVRSVVIATCFSGQRTRDRKVLGRSKSQRLSTVSAISSRCSRGANIYQPIWMRGRKWTLLAAFLTRRSEPSALANLMSIFPT